MGGLFAPLLGWFFKVVGDEARAEIQRKKARERKRKKAAQAKAKAEAARKAAEERRQANWEQMLADAKERAKDRRVDCGPPADLDDNPYGEDPPTG